MKNKKINKTAIALGVLVFLSVFVLNVSVFVKATSSDGTNNVNTIFLQASADDESGGEGSNKWSSPIECSYYAYGAYGSYRVCNVNGSGNTCSPAGSTTCECNETSNSNTCGGTN